MTISLANTSGRMTTVIFTHESYCSARGGCACSSSSGRTARRTPYSLTLPSGVTEPGLDEAVLTIPEVRSALRRGELRAEREEPAPVTLPSAAESPIESTVVEAEPEPIADSDEPEPQPKKKRGNP
jgi:hypothetical protein